MLVRPRRPIVGLFLAVSCVLGLTAAWAVARDVGDKDSNGESVSQPPPPANTATAQILMRAGLSADAICAAGVTQAQQVTALVGAVASEIGGNPNMLTTLDDDYAAKRVTYDALLRVVQSGLGTSQQIAQVPIAKQELDAADALRESYKSGLRQIGLGTVVSGVGTIVNTIYANRSWNELAIQYRVENRSEPEWVTLRDALSVERIAGQYGEPFPAEVQSYLASINAGNAVATAKVNLDTYLAVVQTAWNAAVSN